MRTRSPVPSWASPVPAIPALPHWARTSICAPTCLAIASGDDGELVDEPTDITDHWRDDLVGFAIGCSFSFEQALIEDGIEMRHMTHGSIVPMYRTSITCTSAGIFGGPLVVSMRPMHPAQAIRAVQITSRFPTVHGAPVHIGLPEVIGIKDLMKPDYGDAVPCARG